MVRDILLATDFSLSAEAAETVALEYARRFGSRLHVLHVASSIAGAADPALARLGRWTPLAPDVVIAVDSGAPAERILRYARDHRVDLIVVGSHGRSGITRALLGSIAENVARHAPCPVLIVTRAPGPGEPAIDEVAPSLGRCAVCAKGSTDLICDPCRARIRGEALERKRQIEKGIGGETRSP